MRARWLWVTVLAISMTTPAMARARKPKKPRKPAPVPAYRTGLPEITPDRWTQPAPPLPKPGKVTREDYARYAQKLYGKYRPTWLKRAGDPQQKSQYVFAMREAFLYRFTGDEQYAQTAMKFIRGDYACWTEGKAKEMGCSFSVCNTAVKTYLWLKDSKSLTPADRDFCRKWFSMIEQRIARREVGSHNRATGYAILVMSLMHWWPQEATPQRQAYATQVWNDWWKYRDTGENASHYNSHWFNYVQTGIAATGRENDYQDPAMKAHVYRHLHQFTPLGVIPNYADGGGWCRDPGRVISMLEGWATAYKDGQFKYLAHRLFEYVARDHQAEARQWSTMQNQLMDGLMRAYVVADDSIREQRPDSGSMVTTRKYAIRHTRAERDRTKYSMVLTNKTIPDKLILRTGWGMNDTFALVELAPNMGHGHIDPGAVNAYYSRGSMLLQDTSYPVRFPRYHNCFVVQPESRPDWWQKWSGLQEEVATLFSKQKTTVPVFHESGRFAFAHIRMHPYLGQEGLTVDRRILFLGDAGLWVRDTMTAGANGFAGRVGPAWQATHVYGKQGTTWANLAQVTLPVANTQTTEFVTQWRNRPMDLLVCFLLTAGAEMSVDDVTGTKWTTKPVQNTLAKRLWYKKIVNLKRGESITFNSVLLPHKPTPDASKLADAVKVLVKEGNLTGIALTAADGTRITAGINPAGKPSKLPSSAKAFVALDGKLVWEAKE